MGGKKEIGRNAYVVSKDAGNKAHDQCVLKAHGSLKKKPLSSTEQTFELSDGVEIWFYTPKGVILVGNFNAFLHSDLTFMVVEKCTGEVYDLVLQKSIDYHQGGFDSFFSNAEISGKIAKIVEESPEETDRQGLTNYPFLERFCDTSPFDIVTIRNRLMRSTDLTLSEVWGDLKTAGYDYKVIHCYTCRTDKDAGERYWNVANCWWHKCPLCDALLANQTKKCPTCLKVLPTVA